MDKEEKPQNAAQGESQGVTANGGSRYERVNVYNNDGRAFDRPRYNADNRGYRERRDNRDGGYNSPRRNFNERGGYGMRGEHRDTYGTRSERDNRGYGERRTAYASRYGQGGRGYNPYGGRREEYPRPGQDERKEYGEHRGGRFEYGHGRSEDAFRRPRPDMRYSQRKRIQYAEENLDPDAPIRLNKFLSNAGTCSRRDADKYIAAGVVTVNGEVVTELGTKIKRSDVVRFNNETVSIEKKVYVILNKPKDYVTTSDDPQNRKTVMDLVQGACRERIYPVGRLDRNTTGVLMLTNDGELASKLTHPKYRKKKIYHAYLDRNVSAADMQKIATGVMLDDGEVHADAIEYASADDKKQVGVEIHSGRNRIVRRIFESLGYHVIKLDRVYFAGLTKKNLRRGEWRHLTQEEVNYLKMGEFE